MYVLPVDGVFIIAAVFVDTGYLQGIWGVRRYRSQLATIRRLTENTQEQGSILLYRPLKIVKTLIEMHRKLHVLFWM